MQATVRVIPLSAQRPSRYSSSRHSRPISARKPNPRPVRLPRPQISGGNKPPRPPRYMTGSHFNNNNNRNRPKRSSQVMKSNDTKAWILTVTSSILAQISIICKGTLDPKVKETSTLTSILMEGDLPVIISRFTKYVIKKLFTTIQTKLRAHPHAKTVSDDIMEKVEALVLENIMSGASMTSLLRWGAVQILTGPHVTKLLKMYGITREFLEVMRLC